MSDTEQKPKRVMTEEQKAKMKAGREAAKAKREADKDAGVPAEPVPAPKSDSEGSTESKRKGRPMTEEQKAKMKAGRDAAKAKREADKAAGIETPKKEKKDPKVPATPKKAAKPKTDEPESTTIFHVNFLLRNKAWKVGDNDQEEWIDHTYYFSSNEAIRQFIMKEFEDHDRQMINDIIENLGRAKISHADFIKDVADSTVQHQNAFGPNINVTKTNVYVIA